MNDVRCLPQVVKKHNVRCLPKVVKYGDSPLITDCSFDFPF